MGRKLNIDPEMLENLDFLMNYEAVVQEQDWVGIQNWEEGKTVEEIKEEEEAEKVINEEPL
jgi:hypothetical protein